jgi:sulfur carrier protein
VKATVNGQMHELPDGTTIRQLLARLGAPSGGVAVARNERVVHRGEYDAQPIAEGDRIEIIRAVAGG